MKLAIFLTFALAFHAFAETKAQKITLNVKNTPLREVMKEIQKQQGYSFLFRGDHIADTRVDVQLKQVDFPDAMHVILYEHGLEWSLEDGIITINRLLRDGQFKTNRIQDVTGKVTDEEGNPLLGVTVTVKGNAQQGTISDANGVYALLNLPADAVLIFRYVGYLEQEVVVGSQTSIDVSLVLDQAGLEEVVVVGFGQQKKESVVASVATVQGEQLRMPTRSLSNNLAGQLPGLIAVQRTGEPGYDDAEFWIRGISSFAGGTQPLVLVDGVPRNMNDIDPEEIETFTLLKDAAATSVYGSEGANGVVLITSKRGRVQKTNIAYRGEVSRLSPTRVPRFASAYDYLSLYNEALVNDGAPPYMHEGTLLKYKTGEDPDLYPSVDWWNTLINDHTSNTRHTLNFRGGGELARYFVSGSYFGETGLYKTNTEYNNNAGLKRYNLRSNVDIDVTRTTLLRIDLSGQYLETNHPRNEDMRDMFKWMVHTQPFLFPAVYSDGTLVALPGTPNPYNSLLESGYRKQWRTGIQSKIDLEQKLDFLIPGLKGKVTASYDANSVFYMTRSKSPATFIAEGRDENGNLIFSTTANGTPFSNPTTTNSGNKNIYLEGSLNYNKAFENHLVGGMFLYYQKDRQLHNEALAYRKQAWIGRGTYSFDNRYMLEGNFSITGSEQFADGFRYGFFPAVGLAWNVTNEPFFPENLKAAFTGIKIRASIGKTGNDNTGSARFLYRPTFGTGPGYNWGIGSSDPLNGVGSGIIEDRFEAPSLSWEIEMKRNYGLDLTLFNGKLDIQADYFDNKRTNILLQRRTVSGVAGFRQNPWQNFGVVTNKGLDGSLNLRHNFGEVDVAFRGNFTFARNKIVEYDEIPQRYPWMQLTGTRLRGLGALVAERLFTDDDFNITTDNSGNRVYTLKDGIAYYTQHPNPKPGDIKFVDQNGDGVVDNNLDVVRDYMHPTVPEIIYGFGANASFKGFYASVFFQGAGNVTVNLNNDPSVFQPYHNGVLLSTVRQEVVESRWTENNPSQDVFFPRMTIDGKTNSSSAQNSWWYRNGAFLRFKNLEMGYVLSDLNLSKLKLRQARIYLAGQNIALWDHVGVFDPEMGNSGSGSAYPLPSIWSVGLELTY